MINKTRALFYEVGGVFYKDLAQAQKVDLVALMSHPPDLGLTKDGIADWVLENADAIVDTLTTTPRSRLRARKSHGAKRKPRQPQTTP